MSQPLLQVNNLKKHFPIKGGFFSKPVGYIKAVDGVSIQIERGEAFGLVGESGSGKTTLGQTILRMHEKTSGEVLFDGIDIYSLKRKELDRLRTRIQYIFQDPYSSLNPRIRIGDAIGGTPLAARHGRQSRRGGEVR